MMPSEPATQATARLRKFGAVIFDVDGVLLASPHERAWREALSGLADPARFTTAIYQSEVAGKPRLDGACAALRAIGVLDPRGQAPLYAERKQQRLEALIRNGSVRAFPDALRFVASILHLRLPLALASSSKNAVPMLQPIRLPDGSRLLDVFDVEACGRDLHAGKPDPEIFLDAASELGIRPADCLVVEDAPAGIAAARAGGMAGLGVARLHDGALLRAAAADLVVASLDDVDIDALATGRLHRRAA